jgi:microfibrillar-associated protein 1
MNALIGGPANGDGAEEMAAFRQTGGPQNPRQSSRRTAANEVDISKMTAAETAKMLSEKAKHPASNSGSVRYRSKNKVMAHHQLLAEELSKQQQQQQQQKPIAVNRLHSQERYSDDDDEEDNDEFVRGKRPVQAAVVISQRAVESRRRRRRSDSSSSSSSSSPSSSDDGSRKRSRKYGRNSNNRRDRRRRADESGSSSSSSDEEDDRRRNQRVLASRRMQKEPETILPKPNDLLDAKDEIDRKEDSDSSLEEMSARDHKPQVERLVPEPKKLSGKSGAYHDEDESDSSSSSGSSSSSSSRSSSSTSSSSEEDEPVRLKPIFVPKRKRNLIQSEEKKLEEEELRLHLEKERNVKRKAESRALVAKELAMAETSYNQDADDEENDESRGAINAPPNDDDELDKEKERSAWEIRELERLLVSIDEAESRRREEEEYARRKKLTDAECLQEDIQSGRYQAPGASRERKSDGGESANSSHLNRFFHRGAYYMDESEWDEGDVRRKAAEYASAATGEDKIDKSKLPEVMQVKNFGRARQNTKYKGLSKEDTTDKSAQVLPLRMQERPKR